MEIWELDELLRRLNTFSNILGRNVPVHGHYVSVESRRGWHVVEATIVADNITIHIFCMFFKFWRCALEASNGTECRAGWCRGRLASIFADALREAEVPNVSGIPEWEAVEYNT